MNRGTLNYESARLLTFGVDDDDDDDEKWPHEKPSPEYLARIGFYYIGQGDAVRCFACNLTLSRWRPNDDPEADHRRWSPNCPFLTTSNKGYNVTSAEVAKNDDDDDDGADCRRAVDAITLRVKEITRYRFVNMIPANPKMSSVKTRMGTFYCWPLWMRQKPQELAENGFFYRGVGDGVQCFHCNVALNTWSPDDVPILEHMKWSPRCRFLLEACIQLESSCPNTYGEATRRRVIEHLDIFFKNSSAKTRLTCDDDKKGYDVCGSKSFDVVDDDEDACVSDSRIKDAVVVDAPKLKPCVLCETQPADVAFLPCGHVRRCMYCAIKSNRCIACRDEVLAIVRIDL